MDDRRFDELSRLLGDAATRRAGLKAALAAVLGGPAAVAAVEERAAAGKDRHRGGGKDAGPEAGKRKKRKKCNPACAAGQRCVKGACVCDDGGTACGADCCAIGQRCEGGQCATDPAPDACIAFGEPCKGVGRRCCDGLVCGSGQGGQGDIACYVGKTGACTSTAECTYGTRCEDGVCRGIPQPPPGPNPEPDTCIEPGASGCTGNADCCDSGSVCNDGRCACDAANCDGLCCSGRCVTLENLTFRNVGSFGPGTNAFKTGPGYVQPSADGLTAYVAGYDAHTVTIWTRPSVGGTWTLAKTLGDRTCDANGSCDDTVSGNNCCSQDDRFNTPYGLAISEDQKTLYVADSGNDRISVWTRPSAAAHTGWAFAYKITVTADPNATPPNKGMDRPRGVWLSPDEQTLVAAAGTQVYVFKPTTASVPWVLDAYLGIGTTGSGLNQLSGIFGAFCTPTADECLIADTGNDRIAVWKKSATGWSGTTQADGVFGNTGGTSAGQFNVNGPYQGSLSPSGNVYWGVDNGFSRVTAFRRSGGSWSGATGVVAFGCANALADGCGAGGSAADRLNYPEGLYTAVETGEIFIADTSNKRISIWTGCPV